MIVEMVKLSSLKRDPDNARKHNEKNLSAIKASLKEFGQQKPIVVDKDMVIVAGNGTHEGAEALGWDEIAVVKTGLSKTKAMAYAIADNRSGELAEWDKGNLQKIFDRLKEADIKLDDVGFEPPDLEGLGLEPKKVGLTDDDAIPEVPQNIHGVTRGDIWQLGEHRLMCGDATSKDDVERLMAGEKADMVFTDPPYGMNLDTDFSDMGKGGDAHWKKTATSKSYKKVEADDVDFDPDFILTHFSYCDETFLWGADYYAERIPDKNNGSWVVWDKRENEQKGNYSTESMDRRFGSCFELCWSKAKHKRHIARVLWTGLFGTQHEDIKKRQHPTQKPIALAEWFFEQWGKNKTIIVDLFLGSGSTLIACEKTNRKCYGMEIDPHYCSVVIERWQQFSGKKAVKLGS